MGRIVLVENMNTCFQQLALTIILVALQVPSQLGAEAPSSRPVWGDWLPLEEPLDIEWVGDFEGEGIPIRRLRYTGSIWKGEPQRVYALYSHPEGDGPFPTILQIHGGGQTCYPSNVAYFVRHGYACLSFDWTGPWENRPEEEVTQWPADFHRDYVGPESQEPGQNLVHHATLAAIRGIDVLCEQPEVDPDRIGVQGISWGGYITWLVGALDPRVRAAVPVYGVGGLEKQWSGLATNLNLRSAEFMNYWRTNYDPATFAAEQQGAVLYLDATNDFFGQLSQSEERLKEVTVDHRRSYSPNRMHSLDPETVAAGMAWFEAHLKGNGEFPEEPRLAIGVSADGILEATLQIDPSRAVDSVRLDYSRGGRHDLLKCWLSRDASPANQQTWRATIPLVEAAQPLAVIPQVIYKEGFMLSGAVTEMVPVVHFPKVQASEATGDVLSDWNNGPSGWFISRGTDFIHADSPQARLRQGSLHGREALIYETDGDQERVHLCTRLIADPARNEGNRRSLEIWTHDLSAGEIRTDWQTHQPGVVSYQATLEGGEGWRRNLIHFQDLQPYPDSAGQESDSSDRPPLWNDIQRLDLLATPVEGGIPAVGLVGWTDSDTRNPGD